MKQFKNTLLVALVTSMAVSTAVASVADGTIRFEGGIVEDTALVTKPSNECVTTIKKISENTLANIGNKLDNCLPQTQKQASLQLQPIDKERAVLLVNYD